MVNKKKSRMEIYNGPLECNNCFSSSKKLFVVGCDTCHTVDKKGTVRCKDCMVHFKQIGIALTCCKCEKLVNVTRQWSFGWEWLPDNVVNHTMPFALGAVVVSILLDFGTLTSVMIVPTSSQFLWLCYLYVWMAFISVCIHGIDATIQFEILCRLHHWMAVFIFSFVQMIIIIELHLYYPWFRLEDPATNLTPYFSAYGFLIVCMLADWMYYLRLTYQNGVLARVMRGFVPVKSEVLFRPVS